MKVPEGSNFEALKPVLPVFLTYVLSFIYLAIYWNNHHHFLQAVNRVNGKILWANLNLLFWLSLFPFVTGWMGDNHFEIVPIGLYGVILFMAALAFKILVYFAIKTREKIRKSAKFTVSIND
ncbi:TMEM175 family protein [Aquimarina intermedia]|nr:TMEM175 family protein [Aquimarina intermedia]